jgi:oligoribonuclease NrnB/cAMP/cGMP phosphodiesterase (DHH superfamily)
MENFQAASQISRELEVKFEKIAQEAASMVPAESLRSLVDRAFERAKDRFLARGSDTAHDQNVTRDDIAQEFVEQLGELCDSNQQLTELYETFSIFFINVSGGTWERARHAVADRLGNAD